MRTSAAAVAIAAMTLGLLAGGAAAAPPTNGPISLAGSRAPDSSFEIYSIAADGTGRLDLTDNPAADESPAVSPDGKQIAFVSTRDGYDALYVMNADGSNQHRVCPPASLPAGPCVLEGGGQAAIGDLVWSPTGRTLAFRVVFPGEAICFAPADGDYLLDLADGSPRQRGYGLLGPLGFSPDGRFISGGEHSCKSADIVSVGRADVRAETTQVNGLFVGWAPRRLRLLYERGKKDYQGGYTTVHLATMDPFGGHRWTLKRIRGAGVVAERTADRLLPRERPAPGSLRRPRGTARRAAAPSLPLRRQPLRLVAERQLDRFWRSGRHVLRPLERKGTASRQWSP